jgi:hypothetical protein
VYKITVLLFVTVLARGCDSKIVVDKVDHGAAVPANGVIYALPTTVTRVQVKVDKATATGAPYSPFAAIFAPDGDPLCKYEKIDEDSYQKCLAGQDSYSLQQGATISTYGVPDPEEVFLVRFEGKGAIDQSLSMTLNETGLLSAASSQVTNRTSDIVLSGLKLVTGLGIKAALGFAGPGKSPTDCGPGSIAQDKWIVPELVKGGPNSAAALIKTYCGIKREDRKKFPVVRRPDGTYSGDVVAIRFADEDGKVIRKTFQQLLAEAVEAHADDVDGLIGARLNILQANGQIFEPAALLTRIEAEISQNLTKLFIGTKKTVTWEGSLDLRNLPKGPCDLNDRSNPTCNDLNDQSKGSLVDVLRINEQKGICVTSELAPDSKPIPKKFALLAGAACSNAPAVKMRLNFYPHSDAQLFTRITSVEGSERSFRYRIPAQVEAVLCDATAAGSRCDNDKKTYGSAIFSVAQLGTIISLPATRHSKSLTYELALIESTGALKTIKLNAAGGLDAATIDALSGMAGSVIEARQKGDEINQLTRQQQLLKLQDDICTIQKKYGLPCTVQPQ